MSWGNLWLPSASGTTWGKGDCQCSRGTVPTLSPPGWVTVVSSCPLVSPLPCTEQHCNILRGAKNRDSMSRTRGQGAYLRRHHPSESLVWPGHGPPAHPLGASTCLVWPTHTTQGPLHNHFLFSLGSASAKKQVTDTNRITLQTALFPLHRNEMGSVR